MAAAASELFVEDIIMLILVRLPVKSLVRFRCVCKSWCSLIKNPNFIRYHVNHVNNMDTNTEDEYERQIFNIEGACCDTTFHCMDIYKRYEQDCDHQNNPNNGDKPIIISTKELDFPREFRCEYNNRDGFNINGFCDGMLCLADDDDGLIIWNPSIKECRRLLYPHRYGCSFEGYGIGYDPSIDDYKVLKVPSRFTTKHSEVNVLALKSNSWKKIQDNFPYFILPTQATFTNGCILWLANRERYRSAMAIVYFDVVGELFGEVSLPHIRDGDGDGDEGWFDNLQLLRKNLSLVWYGGGGHKLDLWVMNEYKVRESWTKLLTVPLSEGLWNLPNSFCFVRDGIVLYNKRNGEFHIYNARDQSSRRFYIGGFPCYAMKTTYNESLVSPISVYGFVDKT